MCGGITGWLGRGAHLVSGVLVGGRGPRGLRGVRGSALGITGLERASRPTTWAGQAVGAD